MATFEYTDTFDSPAAAVFAQASLRYVSPLPDQLAWGPATSKLASSQGSKARRR